MANKYRVIPFKGSANKGDTAGTISAQIEQLINEQATQGWEFCEITSVDIEVKPGCLGSLLSLVGFGSGSTTYERYDQIVFKK